MTLREEIEALPEQAASQSRDYGRGYAHAIRDVMEVLERHDLYTLSGTGTREVQGLRTHS